MDQLTELHREAMRHGFDHGDWKSADAIQAEIAARDDERRRTCGAQLYSSADIRAELERVIG
jgi:hypothetical protein